MKLPDLTEAREKYLAAVLSNPPKRGDGLNLWIYAAANGLRRCAVHKFDDAEIVSLITQATEGCGATAQEIVRAVARSNGEVPPPMHGTGTAPKAKAWPDIDHRLRSDVITAEEMTLVGLWSASPVYFKDGEPKTAGILKMLFGEEALLCIGKSNSVFATATLAEWCEGHDLSEFSLIVPNPMSARSGLTQDGKPSAHSLDNTGPRKFLGIECDPQKWNDVPEAERAIWECEDRYLQRRKDEQAAILWHLADYLPLVLAVDSGGKSLQGWFYVAGLSDDELRPLMTYAVTLGADRATWTRSQFVRMPDGKRDNGRRQSIIYFAPEEMTHE